MPGLEKLESVNYLQEHARRVKRSSNIVIIGGGAVGVQMATDIKDLYPNKSVTLVHSRQLLMNNFHHKLHEIVKKGCDDLGIKMVLSSRVKLPTNGYPTDGDFYVNLEDGSRILSDMAVNFPT
jgi:apoptosis-inducing factor 2